MGRHYNSLSLQKAQKSLPHEKLSNVNINGTQNIIKQIDILI